MKTYSVTDYERMRWFDTHWEVVADQGLCDAGGSVEYWRVRDEFIAAGCPTPIHDFILSHSNLKSGNS